MHPSSHPISWRFIIISRFKATVTDLITKLIISISSSNLNRCFKSWNYDDEKVLWTQTTQWSTKHKTPVFTVTLRCVFFTATSHWVVWMKGVIRQPHGNLFRHLKRGGISSATKAWLVHNAQHTNTHLRECVNKIPLYAKSSLPNL